MGKREGRLQVRRVKGDLADSLRNSTVYDEVELNLATQSNEVRKQPTLNLFHGVGSGLSPSWPQSSEAHLPSAEP